jgi:hypothetical protein
MDVQKMIRDAAASPAGVLLASIGFKPESRTGLAFYYQGPGFHITTRDYIGFPEMDDTVYVWGDTRADGEPDAVFHSVPEFVESWRANPVEEPLSLSSARLARESGQ